MFRSTLAAAGVVVALTVSHPVAGAESLDNAAMSMSAAGSVVDRGMSVAEVERSGGDVSTDAADETVSSLGSLATAWNYLLGFAALAGMFAVLATAVAQTGVIGGMGSLLRA